MVSPAAKDAIAKRIAGEIVLSENPGSCMRRWRGMFALSQVEVAHKIGISASVISDYEGGRRKSPGAAFIKKFVEALISVDEASGGRVICEVSKLMKASLEAIMAEAIIDIREFPSPLKASLLAEAVKGVVVACGEELNRYIYGYTVLDSLKAVTSLSGADFLQLLGATVERALIFTKVTSGRSPMVAIRVQPLKPSIVIIHGPLSKVDPLAVKLAESERIPLVWSKAKDEKELLELLSTLFQPASIERRLGEGL